MEFIFKTGYYGVMTICTLLMCVFFLGNLVHSAAGDTWVNKLILLVSGTTGIVFLVWSVRIGHQSGQWLAGAGLAVLGVVLFGLMMLVGMFSFTKIHWQ